MKELAPEILQGAIDLHVHTAPSHFARSLDDFEITNDMDQHGMAGCVIKSHYMPTTARAIVANKHAGCKSTLYGAVTMDWTVGGLNPYAAESDLLLGGKIVWLPTFHAASHMANEERKSKAGQEAGTLPGSGRQPVMAPPIHLLDEKGKIKSAVLDIMDVVKKYDATLGTGHVTYEEALGVCQEGEKRGVRILVTHPDSKRENFSVEQQANLIRCGAMLEKCWLNICTGALSAKEMALQITELGPEHCALTTDFGQASNPSPAKGLLDFIDALLEEGLSSKDIITMCRVNPRIVLNLH